ncbi:MAG: phenylacetate--CoA ligase family protein [Parabacteroides sp.]|nr:phenylacetate--CoA ligase family protein [Parabacteroides sp.]
MKTIELSKAQQLVAEGINLSETERKVVQQERLHELVDYARQHSPYFAKLYANLPDNYTLSDLPITEKSKLLENYGDWVTDRELNLENVLAYVGRDESRSDELLLGKYTALRTSGSSGNPLPMVRDDHRNKIHAQLIAQRLCGQMDPDFLNIRKKKVATVIHTSNGASSYEAAKRMIQANLGYEHNFLCLSVLDSIEHIVEELNRFQPESMTGYPSVLVQLALQQQNGNLHLNLQALASSAEMLSEENFYLLQQAFNCPVANNYCMTEGGEIAMTHNCPHLHLNEDWIIVEPVDKDKKPLGETEEWSEGILVTDLTNYVQPIIRYYVNDVVRIKRMPLKCCPLPQLEIRGRVCPSYTLAGKTFTAAALVTKAEVWPGLTSYQFVQTNDNTLELRGTCQSGYDSAEVLGNLCQQIQGYFAENNASEAQVVWSEKPFVPNKQGGKIPVYIRIE